AGLVDIVIVGARIEHVRASLVGPEAGPMHPVDGGHQGRGAVDHGGVDYLPLTRFLRLEQAGHDAEGEVERAAAEVANQIERGDGRLTAAANRVQCARQRDVVDVVAGGRGEWTFLTPAGHPAVNQTRIAAETDVRSDAQPLHHAGTKALD